MPWIESRYTAKCAECGEAIFVGEKCWWEPGSRKVYCTGSNCAQEMEAEAEKDKENTPKGKLLQFPGSQGGGKTAQLQATRCTDCFHPMDNHTELGCKSCPCLRKVIKL